jgi:hypothetical protein
MPRTESVLSREQRVSRGREEAPRGRYEPGATAPEVTDLRKGNSRLKQFVAEIVPENKPLKKKRDGLRLRRRHVRLTAADKGAVIRLVEGSDLSVRQTLRELHVPRATFCTWNRRYWA